MTLNDLAPEDPDELREWCKILGKAAGIQAGTVRKIVDGVIKHPPEERLEAFALVLDVDIGEVACCEDHGGYDQRN